jgi:hypothetical protein
MGKKVIISATLVFFSLLLLKVGTDICLPYRSSAVFPLLSNRETFYCHALDSWDQYGRTKRTQIFEVLAVPMSQMDKDAINPSTIGWGDLLLFWRVPLILPLITEQIPEYSISSFKLLAFAFSSTIFLALILHYIGLIFRAITESGGTVKRVQVKSAEEELVSTLMGRSNASNNIVSSKKRP